MGAWRKKQRLLFSKAKQRPKLRNYSAFWTLGVPSLQTAPPTCPVTPRHLAGNTRGASGKKVTVLPGLVNGKGGACPEEQSGNSSESLLKGLTVSELTYYQIVVGETLVCAPDWFLTAEEALETWALRVLKEHRTPVRREHDSPKRNAILRAWSHLRRAGLDEVQLMRETGEHPNQNDREVSGRCHSGTKLNSKTKKSYYITWTGEWFVLRTEFVM